MDKWLLKEEQITDTLSNEANKRGYNWINSLGEEQIRHILLQAQLDHCEPLIRQDEAKKFEGWKSPEQHQHDLNELCLKLDTEWINTMRQACQDEHARTLKTVENQKDGIAKIIYPKYSSTCKCQKCGRAEMMAIKIIELVESGKEPEGMER